MMTAVAKAAISLALVAVAVALAPGSGGAARGAAAGGGPDSPFVYGVIPQEALDDADMQLMARTGISSFRIAIYWPEVQPDPFGYNWSAVDALIGTAARAGITPLPYLYGSPSWAVQFDGHGCQGDCTIHAPSTSGSRQAYARFASEAVRQYGPHGRFWAANPQLPYRPIRAWQIWNEQNSPKYFAPRPDPDSYAKLLGAASDAIRRADLGAEVVIGGMWGPRDQADVVVPTVDYLDRLYRNPGVRNSFDSLALHPYAARLRKVLVQIQEARRVAREAGDGEVGLWVTELGWASNGPKDHQLVKGRKGQARLLEQSFGALKRRRLRWNVRGAFWYAWTDARPNAGFICLWCPGAGLRTADGRAKPAWRSMKRVATGSRGRR